jgi:1,2-diacylglycerol 3-beta-galactosyltransferase
VSAAYERYAPDLVISVHPLMQHVPVRVLRQRIKAGLTVRRKGGHR